MHHIRRTFNQNVVSLGLRSDKVGERQKERGEGGQQNAIDANLNLRGKGCDCEGHINRDSSG